MTKTAKFIGGPFDGAEMAMLADSEQAVLTMQDNPTRAAVYQPTDDPHVYHFAWMTDCLDQSRNDLPDCYCPFCPGTILAFILGAIGGIIYLIWR